MSQHWSWITNGHGLYRQCETEGMDKSDCNLAGSSQPPGWDTFGILTNFYFLQFILNFSVGLTTSQVLRIIHLHWWRMWLGCTRFYHAYYAIQVCQWLQLHSLHLVNPKWWKKKKIILFQWTMSKGTFKKIQAYISHLVLISLDYYKNKISMW